MYMHSPAAQERIQELSTSTASMKASLSEARAREAEVCEHSQATEKRAVEAERRVVEAEGRAVEAERRAVETSATLQRTEVDLQRQRKAAEQAKLREQKLAHDIQEVREVVEAALWKLGWRAVMCM